MKMGVDQNLLRPFMEKALKGLFADDTDEKKNDDGEVQIFDLVKKDATNMMTSQSGTGSTTRNKNKTKSLSRRMRYCCAGSECVDPNYFLYGDLKCDWCM